MTRYTVVVIIAVRLTMMCYGDTEVSRVRIVVLVWIVPLPPFDGSGLHHSEVASFKDVQIHDVLTPLLLGSNIDRLRVGRLQERRATARGILRWWVHEAVLSSLVVLNPALQRHGLVFNRNVDSIDQGVRLGVKFEGGFRYDILS